MVEATFAVTSRESVPATVGAGAPVAGPSFRDVLSALNPLQYLPVVGTIYRAVTGDTVPEPLREAGSLMASGLIGGPIGVITNIATMLFEKLSGLDPERIGRGVLAALGIGSGSGDQAVAVVPPTAPPTAPPRSPPGAPSADPPAAVAWTTQQLAAYGVGPAAQGAVRLGDFGADVLNGMELDRLGKASATYRQIAAIAPRAGRG